VAARSDLIRRTHWAATALGVLCVVGIAVRFIQLVVFDEQHLFAVYARNIPTIRNTAWMQRLLKNEGSAASFNQENLKLVEDFFAQHEPGIVLMGDRAGGLGYFLDEGYGLIHLEGLVGSAEFMRARESNQGEEFIDRYKPSYLVTERKRYLETDPGGSSDVLGVLEPINGLSAHSGNMLFCFPRAAILYVKRYTLAMTVRARIGEGEETRYVFDYRQKVPCPAEFRSQFLSLQAQYGGFRKFSLPNEDFP
jgi:hypothetical protein